MNTSWQILLVERDSSSVRKLTAQEFRNGAQAIYQGDDGRPRLATDGG